MHGDTHVCDTVIVRLGSSCQRQRTEPEEPDFSGEWVLVEASGTASDPASALTVRQTIARTTRLGEPRMPYFSDLTVERHFKSGVVSESYKIGMIGGTVPAFRPEDPRRRANGRPWL
jgi:hypothetical protein